MPLHELVLAAAAVVLGSTNEIVSAVTDCKARAQGNPGIHKSRNVTGQDK